MDSEENITWESFKRRVLAKQDKEQETICSELKKLFSLIGLSFDHEVLCDSEFMPLCSFYLFRINYLFGFFPYPSRCAVLLKGCASQEVCYYTGSSANFTTYLQSLFGRLREGFKIVKYHEDPTGRVKEKEILIDVPSFNSFEELKMKLDLSYGYDHFWTPLQKLKEKFKKHE